MDNPNNNEPIEELFRSKAGDYDIPYRESDWLKLEQRLDNLEQQKTTRQKRWMIAAAVLILFSLLSYAVYQNYRDINRLNKELQQTDAPGQTPEKGRNITQNNEQTPENTESGSQNSSEEEREDRHATPTPADVNGAFVTGSEKTRTGIEKTSDPGAFKVPYTNIDQLAVNRLPVNNQGFQEQISRPFLQAAFVPADTDKEHTAKPPTLATAADPSVAASGNGATIGIVAGPDLSTVGSLADFARPGYNLGILVEYPLSSNWSIRGGVMRASVHYVTDGREYHPPGGFWTYGTVPDQTNARCLILDIPISLKYRFWNFGGSSLYATAGMSSYIMLNEEYQFDYTQSNDHLVEGWSGQTGSRHWFSNATLSLGYTVELSNTISFQIEPFLKLPISGVGWGDVQLYSTGSLLSVSYKLK